MGKYIPCHKDCRQCGICCVCRRISDFNLRFYKPAYTKCEYMQYHGSHVKCLVYGSDKMPMDCRDAIERGIWKKLNASCLLAYKRHDNMEHLLWAYKCGYLDDFDIIQDIKNNDFKDIVFFYRVFILPFLKKVPGTQASNNDWFDVWELNEYLAKMPECWQEKIAKLATKTFMRVYKNKIPPHVSDVMSEVTKIPFRVWLFKLRHAIWG